jgi:uncharacterized damage-inducible protein DinB
LHCIAPVITPGRQGDAAHRPYQKGAFMSGNFLEKIFEHNNWANRRTLQACAALSDEQLDAEPRSVTKGSIRATLWHLVESQESYLATLTGVKPPFELPPGATFAQLDESISASGQGLLALVRGELAEPLKAQLRTDDGYFVDPWVVVVQVINHASEHREQINSMLSALGVTPPDMDGWSYGEAEHAIVPATG